MTIFRPEGSCLWLLPQLPNALQQEVWPFINCCAPPRQLSWPEQAEPPPKESALEGEVRGLLLLALLEHLAQLAGSKFWICLINPPKIRRALPSTLQTPFA